jgi:hypothetical protein
MIGCDSGPIPIRPEAGAVYSIGQTKHIPATLNTGILKNGRYVATDEGTKHYIGPASANHGDVVIGSTCYRPLFGQWDPTGDG